MKLFSRRQQIQSERILFLRTSKQVHIHCLYGLEHHGSNGCLPFANFKCFPGFLSSHRIFHLQGMNAKGMSEVAFTPHRWGNVLCIFSFTPPRLSTHPSHLSSMTNSKNNYFLLFCVVKTPRVPEHTLERQNLSLGHR